MKRVNNLNSLKLAKFRTVKGDADRFVSEKERRNLVGGSIKLALAIVRSGKAHGPVNEQDLIAYVTPKARIPEPSTIARQNAIKAGDLFYMGKPCKVCGSTRRYTKSTECAPCRARVQRKRKERLAAQEERIRLKTDALLFKHGFTMEEVKSPCRLAKYHACRKELWQMLRDEGIPFEKIADMYNRDHTSIISALTENKKKRRTYPHYPLAA